MTEIKWTKLRHQMLALISRGGVERARYGMHTWDIPVGVDAKLGFQQRAVSDLVGAGLAQIVRGDRVIGGPVVVTARGAQLLVNWDEVKGPALGEVSGVE